MSTSLSRQLQQLRAAAPASTLTSASAAASSDLFSQGPFLIDEHDELDLNSLRQHARAAYDRLSTGEGGAGLDRLMRRRLQLDDVGDEDAMDDGDDEGPTWQEDLLLLLSPSALGAPAQMLLQWLVTRHRVHESHGEELLVALLPYYEYRIFARAVDAVAGGRMNRKDGDGGAAGDRCRGPGWLAAFREACHPATTIGLRRHLAADRGFFSLMCQWAVKVHRHMVKSGQLRVGSYGDMLHFFCSALLGTLSTCNNVSEQQVHALLQVVVEGLRSDSRDFFALGAILAARVLPRVALKAKVADKLAKVLDKKVRKGEETAEADTLTLTLILFKSQRNVVDKEKILRLLSRHKSALDTLFLPKEEGALNATLARKTLSTLSSVCEAVSSSPEPSDAALSLFETLRSALCSPAASEFDHDSVVLLIKSVSKAYLAYKVMKKSAAKSHNEDRAEQCKAIASSCKKVLAELKSRHPSEYLEHSAVQTGDVDIAFMGGKYDSEAPTSDEIAAKRVILDDATVAALTKVFDLASIARRVRCSETKKIRKESARGLSLLFESVSPKFIVDQVEGVRLARLVVNLMPAYDKKPSVIEPVLKFACSKEFHDDQEVMAELGSSYDFELALLPYLVLLEDSRWQSVLAGVKNSWFIKNKATFLSKTLEQLQEKKLEKNYKDSHKEVREDLIRSLCDFIDGATLVDLARKAVSDPKHHDPTIFGILLRVATKLLTEKTSKSTLSDLSETILSLISCGVDKMELLDDEEKEENESKELYRCRTNRKLSASLAKQCLNAVSSNKELANDKVTLTKMLHLACPAKKKNMNAVSKAARENLDDMIGTGEKMESYALETFTGSDDGITSRMRVYCGKKLRAAASSSNESRKRLLRFRSGSLGRILTAIGDTDNRVAKQAFSVLEASLESEDSDSTHQTFYPLVAYLVGEKEQIMAGENLSASFERFLKSGGKDSEACARALLNRCTSEREEWPTFARLESIMKCLKHPTEVATLAEFGLELIKDEGADSKACLGILASHFMPRMLANMERRPCLDFVLAAAALRREVSYAGVSQKVGVLALRNLQGTAAPDCSKFFKELVALADKVDDGSILFECRGVIKGLMGVTSNMFLEVLEELWSAPSKKELTKAATPAPTRSSRRLSQLPPKKSEKTTSSNVISDQKSYSKEERWRVTIFTLEMFLAKSEDGLADTHLLMKTVFQLLKKLEEEEHEEDSYALDVLLSCALAILDQSCSQGAKAGEASGAAVNPELLVKCLNSSANPATRSTALMVLARSCAAGDAEYVIQNSVSIFTFMGSHFLRVDSKHSFEVACAAIDIIIPHIQKVKGKSPVELRKTNMSIISTFADAALDMPVHRFRAFLNRLILCLGERDYLWILTLLLLQATGKRKTYLEEGGTAEKTSKSIKFAEVVDFYSLFGAIGQVEGLLKMLLGLKPDLKALEAGEQQHLTGDMALLLKGGAKGGVPDATELERIRIKSLSFAVTLMTSDKFKHLSAKTLRSTEDGSGLKNRLELIVECAILNLSVYQEYARRSAAPDEAPLAGAMRAKLPPLSERVVESALGLLPSSLFVELLGTLLRSDSDAVRRRALEVFNAKLQGKDEDAQAILDLARGREATETDVLRGLLEPLTLSAVGSGGKETELNQQLSIVALRSFGKALGSEFPGEFKVVCAKLTSKKFLKELKSNTVIASVLFCLPELFQAIGPHAVPLLPHFVSWQLQLLSAQENLAEMRTAPLLLNSAILSVQKLLETFAGFLSPHLPSYVAAACRLAASFKKSGKEDHKKHHSADSGRVRGLLSTLARALPSHSVVAVSEQCYDDLMDDEEEEDPYAIAALMTVISENVSGLNKSQALALSSTFIDFFVRALEYRKLKEEKQEVSYPHSATDAESIDFVEGETIQAFLSLTLKLALDDFKPIFYRMFNPNSDIDDRAALTTSYHVAQSAAAKLKSLFEFVCESLVQRTTTVLDHYCKAAKEDGAKVDENLFEFALGALSEVFAHNRLDGLLTKSYEEHVDALLAVFEAAPGQPEVLGALTDCLSRLAAGTQDDAQWKYLNYHVLLCLRSPDAEVRRRVLAAVAGFVEARGETYLAVLPDATPFLCEVMEDEEEDLEAECRKLLKRMEEVFGQSIEGYFE